MFKKLCYISFSFLTPFVSFAQNWSWENGTTGINTQANHGIPGIPSVSNNPGARLNAATWTDPSGNLWLFGGSISSTSFLIMGDLWKFDTNLNSWIWISGATQPNSLGVYGSLGVPNFANNPGARVGAATWTDNLGNLWLFGGGGFDQTSTGKLSDLWKFDISLNQWIWIGGPNTVNNQGIYGLIGTSNPNNSPGGRDLSHSFFFNNNLYLFGGNGFGETTSGSLNDIWAFSLLTMEWSWIKGSKNPTSLNTYGTLGIEAPNNTPSGRQGGAFASNQNGVFYFLGGENYPNNYFSDLWAYNAITNNWRWVKGPNTPNNNGIYGTIGTYSALNNPGCRQGAKLFNTPCGIYLLGGYGKNSSNSIGYLNDLWQFNPNSNNWRFIKGTSGLNQPGIYGNQGVPANGNYPGNREYYSSWLDASYNLWIFGGWGYHQSGTFGVFNDLWKYNPQIPSIISPNADTVCSGNNFVLSITSNNTTSITWYAQDNINVTGENTNVTNSSLINDYLINLTSFPQTVNYIIQPFGNSGCPGVVHQIAVLVEPVPVISTFGQSTICSGDTLAININTNITSTTNWQAIPNPQVFGETSTVTNTNLINDILINNSQIPANVLYLLNAISTNGCSSPTQNTIIVVNPQPNLTITAPCGDTICEKDCGVLLAATADHYLWSTGDTTSCLIVDSSGFYSVTGTNGYSCSSTSSLNVVFLPSNDTVIHLSGSDSLQFNSTTYYQTGVYFQYLTNQYGCDSTLILDIDLTNTSLNFLNSVLSFYPNPTNDKTNIQVPFSLLNEQYILYDKTGRVLKLSKIKDQNFILDLTDLMSGFYFLKIKSHVHKLIKL